MHPPGTHVVVSELRIEPDGELTLEDAFRDRLGAVDTVDGFLGLEVWRDPSQPGRYLMVSWWADSAAYRAYMRSESHRRSHARIPRDPHAPRGVGVQRLEVVAR